MSEIYTHACNLHEACAQRSPLGPPENKCACTAKIANVLTESEYELGKEKSKNRSKKQKSVREREDNYAEFEFADDAISLNNEDFEDRPLSRNSVCEKETSFTENPYITVNGKEELPCVEEIKPFVSPKHTVETKIDRNKLRALLHTNDNLPNFDGNYNKLVSSKISSYCTLPKRKDGYKSHHHIFLNPPKRITPDGTHIYYWCDLRKKCNGKLILLAFTIYNY